MEGTVNLALTAVHKQILAEDTRGHTYGLHERRTYMDILHRNA